MPISGYAVSDSKGRAWVDFGVTQPGVDAPAGVCHPGVTFPGVSQPGVDAPAGVCAPAGVVGIDDMSGKSCQFTRLPSRSGKYEEPAEMVAGVGACMSLTGIIDRRRGCSCISRVVCVVISSLYEGKESSSRIPLPWFCREEARKSLLPLSHTYKDLPTKVALRQD